MKPQTDGLGCLPGHNAQMGVGPPTGEVRPPGRWNPTSASLFSQNAPLEPTEPGHSKKEQVDTAFPLGTDLIRYGARRGRGHEREKVLKGGRDQLTHCPPLETLPAAQHRKWLPQADSTGIHRLVLTRAHCPVLLGNELPIETPRQPPGSLLGTHVTASPF